MIYCPDRHIVYDGRTPAVRGVGGGVTARVRMGKALAGLGHQTTMVVNCMERETIEGVQYVPLDAANALDADVVILTTSGDALDLGPALSLSIRCRTRIVWCHGVNMPAGARELNPDAYYVVSRFIGRIARDRWGVPARDIVVTYNGYDEAVLRSSEDGSSKDEHRLIYFSHPAKGLDAALGVLARLRQVDRLYHLDVFGGPDLWGGEPEPRDPVSGVDFHGMVGQSILVKGLRRATFSLQLQTIEDAGALAIPEAQSAGCVLLASPVGCYPEQIEDGRNGFLVEGDPLSPKTQESAAHIVLRLGEDRERAASVGRAARASALSVQVAAHSWSQLWETDHDRTDMDELPGVGSLGD